MIRNWIFNLIPKCVAIFGGVLGRMCYFANRRDVNSCGHRSNCDKLKNKKPAVFFSSSYQEAEFISPFLVTYISRWDIVHWGFLCFVFFKHSHHRGNPVVSLQDHERYVVQSSLISPNKIQV